MALMLLPESNHDDSDSDELRESDDEELFNGSSRVRTHDELRGLQYNGPDCLSRDATQSSFDSCTIGISRVQVDDSDWDHEVDRRILYPRLLKGYTFSDDADECGDEDFSAGKNDRQCAVHQVVEVNDKLQGEEIKGS